jgi:2-keto-3-deoxy-L-rhamnonate aldolase RhmA
VPGADPLQLKKVLDMGPAGIIFPQLRNIEEIKYAVSCCKYPPDGIRGYGPRRPVNYGIMNYNEYSKLSDSEPWIIIQIENIDVVNNLKEVLKIKGVDSVAVGPSDLSFSIGFPNNITHPDVLKAFDYIGKICRESNVPLGIPIGTADVEDVKLWLKRGVSWIQGDGDGSHILSGGMNSYNIIKKAYEEVKNKS